jgi:hypothetical protein
MTPTHTRRRGRQYRYYICLGASRRGHDHPRPHEPRDRDADHPHPDRGGRKLIMTPEGAAMPTPKWNRDETPVGALVRAHSWRRRMESGQAK